MSESNNLFWLKLLVYCMGIVLTLGSVAMIYFTYHQIFERPAIIAASKDVSPESPAPLSNRTERVACKDSTVDLTKRGTIISSSVGTDRLTRVVILKMSGEYEVVSVDGCTGQITHTLTIPTSFGTSPSPAPAESPPAP